MTVDLINRPPHYITESGIEVIDVIERYGFGESFHLGNAVKYLLRAGRKGNRKQDLEKALYYLNRFDGLDEPTWPEAFADVLEWADPLAIIQAFQLERTHQGTAVSHLLHIGIEKGEEANFQAAIAHVKAAIAEALQ